MGPGTHELEGSRAALRSSILEGLVANGRALGWVEAHEVLGAVMAAQGLSLPSVATGQIAEQREMCERHEQHLRELWGQADTADEATLRRLNVRTNEFCEELREMIAERRTGLERAEGATSR
jgi:uncharacterized coiled-coil protein SlyX